MSERKSVTLEDFPRSAQELEDYVAALFQSARFFVEKNIEEREMLELDSVATSYEGPIPSLLLAEAKSGDWGFPDIFKLIGWMKYLDIKKGTLFVSKDIPDKEVDSINKKIAHLDVSVIHLGDFSEATERFKNAGYPEINESILMTIWRFSYWVEHKLISNLRNIKKADLSKQGPIKAMDYHHLVNDKIFFVKDVRERLHDLYNEYKNHPRISLGAAIEMSGGQFDAEAVDPTNQFIKEAIYDGRHELLQACFYIEHRARLAILKAAIDYLCLSEAGIYPEPSEGIINLNDTLIWSLPQSFQSGLDFLRTKASYRKYALFWQIFLWGFGGFYLDDRKALEFIWLSEQSGVPVDEIPSALEVYDLFFPTGSSWITKPGPTQCLIVKMVPTAFQGIGAYQRKRRYEIKEYRELGYHDKTINDLRKWNNATVNLLKS